MIKQIPTTVIMGFLGSGKTTIIMNLVDNLAKQGQKVVYIKNEVGQVDLDAKWMKGKVLQTKELLNGCVCCTLVGPLLTAIDELIDRYHPDRIMIESAGSADPASMALAVSSHPRLLRDGVISIIDVVNFDGYEDLNIIARRQTEFTDLIVFNKVELVDDQRKVAVVGYVRELNEKSPIVEAIEGQLDPRLAFGLEPKFDLKTLQQFQTVHHHDQIETFSLTTNQKINKDKLLQKLLALPRNVIRVKGVVFLDDGTKQIINGVGKRFNFFDLDQEIDFDQTTLIFIGFKIADLRHQLEQQLFA